MRETNFMGSLFVYRVAALCELRRKRGESRDANEAERVCGGGISRCIRGSGVGMAGWCSGYETKTDGEIRPPDEKFLATLPRLMEIAQLPGIGLA